MNHSTSYPAVERLIHDIAWKFNSRYGGDIEELIAEANFLYMLAKDNYDESKAEFTTWLYCKVWYGLLNFIRREYRHIHMSIESLEDKEGNEFVDNIPDKTKPFSLLELIDELPDDTAFIVRLLFNAPKRFGTIALKRGSKPRNVRAGLREYLHKELGWTDLQVKKSFTEIRDVLKG